MATLTQGTELYWIDDTEVMAVTATNISGISAQRDTIDTTDLSCDAKTFAPGLMSPGSAQFSIHFDPSSDVHKRLHEAYKAGTTLKWALGWSDGSVAPTFNIATKAFSLPNARSFLSFDGFIKDVTFDFALNNVVTSQVSIQVSGMPTLSAKE